MGRVLYPVWLALRRLRRRTGRVALVGLGVATGAGALAAVLAGSLVAQDRSLARATAQVAPAERTVRAVWGGIPGQTGSRWQGLDRQARPILGTLHLGEPFAATLFRESVLGNALVDLGGVQNLGRWVRLESGRLPRPCRPERCEVLQLAGSGPLPHITGLRIVRVGRGKLTSALPIENFISRESEGSILAEAQRYHTAKMPPFLLAEGVRTLADAPALAASYRGYDWVLPIRPGTVHPWTIDRFAADVDRVRSAFSSGSDYFDVIAPVEELQAANDSSRGTAPSKRSTGIGRPSREYLESGPTSSG